MIRNLPPVYFAFVMGTGIVSIAAELQGFHAAAAGFFFVAASGYFVLWILTLARLIFFHRQWRLISQIMQWLRGFLQLRPRPACWVPLLCL